MPLRKKTFTPKEHIRYLRWSIVGVAVFIYLFSLYFPQTEDIKMFMILSGLIFLGGSGIVIIGGLYWRKGTTAGAWAAMITGLLIAIAAFVVILSWPPIAAFMQSSMPGFWNFMCSHFSEWNAEKFFLTPQEIFFFSTLICSASYVVVSLLTKQKNFSFDKLLHRGKYAIEGEESPEDASGIANWKKTLGLEKNLPLGDKLIIAFSYSYLLIALGTVLLGTIYHMIFGIDESSWLAFWHGYVWVFFVLTVVLAIWLTVGGLFDLKKMYHLLTIKEQDNHDDGTVFNDDQNNNQQD